MGAKKKGGKKGKGKKGKKEDIKQEETGETTTTFFHTLLQISAVILDLAVQVNRLVLLSPEVCTQVSPADDDLCATPQLVVCSLGVDMPTQRIRCCC